MKEYCPSKACCAIRLLLLNETYISNKLKEILRNEKGPSYNDIVKNIIRELDEYCEKEIRRLREYYPNITKLCETPSSTMNPRITGKRLTYDKIAELCSCSKQTVDDAKNAIITYVRLIISGELEGRTIIDILDDVRKRRKQLSGLSRLKPDDLTKILLLRLQGLNHKQIADRLKLTTNTVRWVLDQLQHMIATYSIGTGIRVIYNRGLKFFKVESRTIYPTDPRELIEVIEILMKIDKTAQTPEEFKNKAQLIVNEYNKKLKPFGIKLELRKGSPFEKRGRPYALRIRRRRRIPRKT